MEEGGGRTPTASPRLPISPRLLAAAMAAVPSWADVPDVRVSAFLPCRADRVHMASVNRHWRAAVRGLRRPPPPLLPPLPDLPPQLPWLIFPSTVPPTFYSVLGRSYHRLYGLPVDVGAARCCGSGDGGWLLLAFRAPHAYAHALYNLNSGKRIPLPGTFRYTSNNAKFPLYVHAATFSTSTCNRAPYVVAAIALVDERPTAAFWCHGRESWFSMGDPLTAMPEDVIYREGGGAFCFVMPGEELIMYGPALGPNGDGNGILRRWDVPMSRRPGYVADFLIMFEVGMMKRYLVQSQGRLLMVVRYVFNAGLGTDFLRVCQLFAYRRTIDVHQPTWVWDDINKLDLDGLMLFLGTGCSRSFEVARYNGFREAMIYFLDESFVPVPAVPVDDGDDEGAAANDMGSVNDDDPDTGRYSLTKMRSMSWPPGPPRSDVPPSWWLH